MATLSEENISLGLPHSFRAFVCCHHGRKHGGAQADMEKEPRILHLD